MVIIMEQVFINSYQCSCLWMTLMLITMTNYLTYSLTTCNNYEGEKLINVLIEFSNKTMLILNTYSLY